MAIRCFNTQPPEGGWLPPSKRPQMAGSFNTQPPEGGWLAGYNAGPGAVEFQHTAARRRLGHSKA